VRRRMQCGRAVGKGDRMADPEVLGERALEGLDPRSLCEEWIGHCGTHRGNVRLVYRLAAVREEVRQGTICSDGSIARNSSAVSCTGLVSLL
jgi:hypothetical protein